MRDPYTVLGVAKSANADDIKKAYRKLAKKFHPDHNKTDPKAQDKFAEVNQAYEILGEEAKRAQFDRGEIDGAGKPRGFEGFGAGGPGGFRRGGAGGFEHHDFNMGGGSPFGGGVHIDPSEIFADLFGGARGGAPGGARGRTRAAPRGEDVQATLSRLNVSNRVITAVLTANRLSWTKARHWAAYFKREHMLGTARLTS